MAETPTRITWTYHTDAERVGYYLVTSSGGVFDPVFDSFTLTVPRTTATTQDVQIVVDALQRIVARQEE